jgi:hypothetical protein
VRESVRRIGEGFASGLDRDALLELALRAALDATSAERGRVSARQSTAEPLTEAGHVGSLAGWIASIYDAARRALAAGTGIGEAAVDGLHIATVALGPICRAAPPTA